jgi:hypothetical protein
MSMCTLYELAVAGNICFYASLDAVYTNLLTAWVSKPYIYIYIYISACLLFELMLTDAIRFVCNPTVTVKGIKPVVSSARRLTSWARTLNQLY